LPGWLFDLGGQRLLFQKDRSSRRWSQSSDRSASCGRLRGRDEM